MAAGFSKLHVAAPLQEPSSREIRVSVDGREVSVPDGTTVASALAIAAAMGTATATGIATATATATDTPIFRRSVRLDEPRSAVCGMGICHECRVTVDGVSQVRSCLLLCTPGMVIASRRADAIGEAPLPTASFPAVEVPTFADVLVIGAGPAGLAAAARAGRGGRDVVLVDENPSAGGQIWRGEADERREPRHALHLSGTAAVDYWPEVAGRNGAEGEDGARGTVLVLRHGCVYPLRFRDLVLATGARELFLPYPGWTLPNVFGAGGLQALVKSGWPIAGRRVVIAGSGPLLLAAAALLRRKGAEIVTILEQAPLRALLGFGRTLLTRPDKWIQTAELRTQLAGVPYRPGHWVLAAEGRSRVERVVLTDGSSRWSETCDALALAYGLVPATEFARLIGCETDERGAVRVDGRQATTVPGVYAAGELTGIGGLDLSLAQGDVLGSVLAGEDPESGTFRHLLARRARAERFAEVLGRAFALRPEVRRLAHAETVVCRCEDVGFAELERHRTWRDAKLVTRCGMGPCQGRVCGAALREILGWPSDVPRPPISPVPVGAWITAPSAGATG